MANDSRPPRAVERALFYRQAPHDSYLVFVTPERALLIDQLHHAITDSKTWGEFRRQLPAGEYHRLFKGQFSTDPEVLAENECAREPHDAEPFNSDRVPGYSDGDYPPWLAQELDRHVPDMILREFATRESSFINGSFWRLDATRTEEVVERLVRSGFRVERRDDLMFW